MNSSLKKYFAKINLHANTTFNPIYAAIEVGEFSNIEEAVSAFKALILQIKKPFDCTLEDEDAAQFGTYLSGANPDQPEPMAVRITYAGSGYGDGLRTVFYEESAHVWINNVEINNKVFTEGKIGWRLWERTELITHLKTLLKIEGLLAIEPFHEFERPDNAGAGNAERIKKNIELLSGWTDTYVWSSATNNYYLSPTRNTELFNDACRDALRVSAEL